MNLFALLRRARPARDMRHATKTRPRLECLEDRYLLTETFTSFQFGLATDMPVQADYDGDGRTDVAVVRPVVRTDGVTAAVWYIQGSRDGFRAVEWGFGDGQDEFVPADYDGDDKIDIAVFRPANGTWHIMQSRDGFRFEQFGQAGDVPVPADYDGDGRTDVAVVRPVVRTDGVTAAVWYIRGSRDGFRAAEWGFGDGQDEFVPADYDGDLKADVAVFRPANGTWYILRDDGSFYSVRFGQAGDVPTPGDYDEDGKADVAVFRPDNGTWYVQGSTSGFSSRFFGQRGDDATPGDYDGDLKSDFAVFRPGNGTWYILTSNLGRAADEVLAWNDVLLDAARLDSLNPPVPPEQGGPEQGGPTRASRAMAIVHAAIFDAVNGIDRQYRPYLVQETARDLNPLYSDASVKAAVVEAAYRTLVALYPRQTARLDVERANALRAIPDGSSEDHGIAYGGYVADRILDARSGDIPNTPDNYPTDTQDGVGRWQREDDPRALRDLKGRPIESPVTPAWGNVRPFTLTDGQAESFRAGELGVTRPAPDLRLAFFLRDRRYTTAFNEVKRVGRSDAEQRGDRTADQTAIARFWSYDDNLGSTVRLYNLNVRDVVASRPNTPLQNARLFALVNLAMADAGIVTWGTKYEPERDYATNNFWRPVAGIRRAETDNNPSTEPDPDWLPLGRRVVPNATPTHPSYTSGHASFGAALFGILEQFYGPDDVTFTLRSEEPGGGGTRGYSSFREARLENGESRIYLGVHWRFDSDDGDGEGERVANHVYRNYLTQLPSGPGATPASVAPILATAGVADSILSPPPSEGGPEFVFAPDTLTDEPLIPFARRKKKKT